MTCASFPSQTLSPTPRSKSLPQSSSAACVCLHFIETNQKRGRYLRGKTAISRSSTRLLPWVPLCARKPPPRGESQKQEQMAPSSPLSDLIHGFCSSVNEKELSRLEKLLSKDCIFESSAYSKPLQGKRINQFFKELTEAMGTHVRFVIDEVYEGKELTTAATWHLEWNNQFIPLTKGCSFFKCSKDGDLLLIKEARVLVESPVKPGDLVLGTLKRIISLFDKFPRVAGWYLRKHDVLLHYICIIYMFLRPVILPLFVYYTNQWVWLQLKLPQNILQMFIDYVWKLLLIIIKRLM
ncbi:uncharacterized protein LOC135671563 [Musa acuminata AAA Group]|uniref:uncharacterized protein LOC103970850 n=1 Tax=Musa acuminata AAA Group TaxID=214697 RepID=UPI0031D73747